MKMSRITTIATTTLAAGLLAAGGAHAQSTWNVYNGSSGGSGCSQNTANSGNFNNSWACTGVGDAGTSMTASAWSMDRGTGTSRYLSLPAGSGSAFASAYMSSQGDLGFGAASRTEGLGAQSPNHAFDSIAPGTGDMMLLDFGKVSVVLDKIGIGWKGSNDSDITVMRWTGAEAPKRIDGMTSAGGKENLDGTISANGGWELVGSFADLSTDYTTPFGGAAVSTGATKASSWWLISTFNTTFNGGGSGCTKQKADGTQFQTTCGAGNDAFKLNFIATLNPKTPPSEVPEPGSLALAGIALVGVLGARRRGKQRS